MLVTVLRIRGLDPIVRFPDMNQYKRSVNVNGTAAPKGPVPDPS
jgi:hypothetical protein